MTIIKDGWFMCECCPPLPPKKLCRVGENPKDVYIKCPRCGKEVEIKKT